tara:strand:+ start:311 stop:592 length:282 start_codon:yes stop_codon:yes gene_type:complete
MTKRQKNLNKMIKLKDILMEAKWDNIAGRVWDHIISNEIHVTQDSLREISDTIARQSKISKDGLYSAVMRVGEEKNWFTKFIMYPNEGGAGVF